MRLGRSSATGLVAAAFLVSFLVVSGSAHAQISDDERKAAARMAYGEGIELQDKGKPAEALGRFESAEKLFDAPTHLLHIAECEALTGKLVEASETYETLSRKTLPPGSPDAFVQAQEAGKTELAALRPRIPTMRITVSPDPAQLPNLQVTINEKQMPSEVVGITRPVNPGTYKIWASATGWSTPTPVMLEMPESQTKTVELTLQQGAAQPVATPTSPPPYDEGKTKIEPGPSPTGLLFGPRLGVVVPAGDLDKTHKLDTVASAGPGFGFDLLGRVAKYVLVGGTLEISSLGAPDSATFPAGTRALVSTTGVYLGIVVGIVPNIDRFSFIADLGLGYRGLHENLELTNKSNGATAFPKTDLDYSGYEFSIDAGVSIPAGPVRVVPKAAIGLGSFGSASCSGSSACTNTASTNLDSSSHAMLSVNLAIYYDIDLSKRAKPATSGSLAPSASGHTSGGNEVQRITSW